MPDPATIISIQDTIAERVIAGLKLNLTEEEQEKIEKPLTKNAEAYEFYLRGRDLRSAVTDNTVPAAVREEFEKDDGSPLRSVAIGRLLRVGCARSRTPPPGTRSARRWQRTRGC